MLNSLPEFVLEAIRKSSEHKHGQKVADDRVISDAMQIGGIYCPECMQKWKALYPDFTKQDGGGI